MMDEVQKQASEWSLAVLVCAVRLPHAPATPSCRSHRPALEIDSAEPPEAKQRNGGTAG